MVVSTGERAITGGDLAHDHGRPDFALGLVISGSERGDLETGEQLVLVAAEVLGEAEVGGLGNPPHEQRADLRP